MSLYLRKKEDRTSISTIQFIYCTVPINIIMFILTKQSAIKKLKRERKCDDIQLGCLRQ
mgnify:CR=1 FL=1